MVRSEGNISLKNPVTPQGIDPGTVRIVAQRLNKFKKEIKKTYKMLKILLAFFELPVCLRGIPPFRGTHFEIHWLGPRAVLADGLRNKKISRINRVCKHVVMYFAASYCRHQHFAIQRC